MVTLAGFNCVQPVELGCVRTLPVARVTGSFFLRSTAQGKQNAIRKLQAGVFIHLLRFELLNIYNIACNA